jgi:hypothetical protein
VSVHWRKQPAKGSGPGRSKFVMYERAREAIEYLMECQGHTPLSKREFADEMANRYGRPWITSGGQPDRRLVSDVCNLTRDQDHDPTARELFGGYMIAYAPNSGGMVLIDPSGEMALHHHLHFLAGDVQMQQKAKTVMRRRISDWKAAALSAMSSGDYDLGRLLSQAENEIDRSGFISDTLVVLYLKALTARGVHTGDDDAAP